MEYRHQYSLSKFDRSVFLILKPISFLLVFCVHLAWFLSRNYWSSLDHDLMASIWEKAISILAENLNSGRSYLITAVFWYFSRCFGYAVWKYYCTSVNLFTPFSLTVHLIAFQNSAICCATDYGHTIAPSMSFYPDFIQILSWFHPDFIQILSKFYPNFIQILT